jgi:hypothetical protein
MIAPSAVGCKRLSVRIVRELRHGDEAVGGTERDAVIVRTEVPDVAEARVARIRPQPNVATEPWRSHARRRRLQLMLDGSHRVPAILQPPDRNCEDGICDEGRHGEGTVGRRRRRQKRVICLDCQQ